MKRRGAQRVRFTIERKLVWSRDALGYRGHFLSEPHLIAGGVTLAELRWQLVDMWRRKHGAVVKPTGRPPRLPPDRRSTPPGGVQSRAQRHS